MRMILFSGKGGSGVSTLAAATAVAATMAGHRALAFGLGPGLREVLGSSLGAEPLDLGGNLSASEGGHGGEDEFREWLEQLLDWRGMEVELAADLAALPGISHISRLLELESEISSAKYDVIVLDCGPLTQFLDLPPALDAAARWLERLFAPRQATVFDPFVRVFAGDYASAGEDVLDRGRELLGRLAAVREAFTDPNVSSVRLVLTAANAKAGASEALSVLALFTYPADAAFVNRLIPGSLSDPFLASMRKHDEVSLTELSVAVAPIPVIGVDLQQVPPSGQAALAQLAKISYEGREVLEMLHASPEAAFAKEGGAYVLTLALPFAREDALDLERTDSGIAIHLNGRRRLVALPEEARYHERASWGLEDGILTVVFEV